MDPEPPSSPPLPPPIPPESTVATTSYKPYNSSSRKSKREGGACAACRHQRRGCKEDCIMAPYFPNNETEKFGRVHRLFGLNNVVRSLKNTPPEYRDDAVKAIVFEANARARDPVGGCYRIVGELERRVQAAEDHFRFVAGCLQIARSRKLVLDELAVKLEPGVTDGRVYRR